MHVHRLCCDCAGVGKWTGGLAVGRVGGWVHVRACYVCPDDRAGVLVGGSVYVSVDCCMCEWVVL